MSILGAVIVPHPPLIIPAVGRGLEQEVQTTIDAYRTAAGRVANWGPEVYCLFLPLCTLFLKLSIRIAPRPHSLGAILQPVEKRPVWLHNQTGCKVNEG